MKKTGKTVAIPCLWPGCKRTIKTNKIKGRRPRYCPEHRLAHAKKYKENYGSKRKAVHALFDPPEAVNAQLAEFQRQVAHNKEQLIQVGGPHQPATPLSETPIASSIFVGAMDMLVDHIVQLVIKKIKAEQHEIQKRV